MELRPRKIFCYLNAVSAYNFAQAMENCLFLFLNAPMESALFLLKNAVEVSIFVHKGCYCNFLFIEASTANYLSANASATDE
jgi:hypothetical protein